ncbi:hypothetical protein EVAR_87171_1 [Eumeta japonica]|uniref:DUF4371 domain-containing protein n=1 Tax=Eumeta variegata TaxID=151549 RepID=A0A4C1VVP1_EUMVA|nr:hypothetical protein EVAR_87171_1 [Eumeta japonica]
MIKFVGKNCHTSAARYAAANVITRHSKPFQEGEFLKETWLACAPSLFDDFDNKDKIIQRIKDTPLSRNTIKERILKLAENITDQQKIDINDASFISLCLDKSTDVTKSARSSVFARVSSVRASDFAPATSAAAITVIVNASKYSVTGVSFSTGYEFTTSSITQCKCQTPLKIAPSYSSPSWWLRSRLWTWPVVVTSLQLAAPVGAQHRAAHLFGTAITEVEL